MSISLQCGENPLTRACPSKRECFNRVFVTAQAYFEVKLQSAGVWGFGVAVPEEDLEKAPLGESTFSWVLQNSGKICHNKKCIHDTKLKIEEGDILVGSFCLKMGLLKVAIVFTFISNVEIT